MSELENYRVACISDSGFATLTGEQIIESNAIALAEVLFFDGVIHFHGSVIDHRCA